MLINARASLRSWTVAAGRRFLRLFQVDFVVRIASVALTTVLIVSILFNMQAARVTSVAASAAIVAHTLDDDFAAARYAVGAEESLERKYRLEPDRQVYLLHRASAASLVSAMHAVLTLGDAQDRIAAQRVLKAHRAYLNATAKMFAAIDRHDTARVTYLDHNLVDPVFGYIEHAVSERARTHLRDASHTLNELNSTQRQLITIGIALSICGLMSLGAFRAVLQIYQRRLTASHQMELKRLQDAALVDNLTSIGNHRAYQEELHREVSRAQRYGETLSLVTLDIDDFKVINDVNGHVHGDEVLRAVAAQLRTLREEDRPFRLGGDEFAMLLPHTTAAEAMETMQRLSGSVRTHVFGTTVSIGISTLAGAECDQETLQAQADAAMYSGKRAGRNNVTAFDPSMHGMWPLSPKKIHSLRELIVDGQMEVAFQPIWDVEVGSALAYEALSRPDPKYGFDGPQEAFDLAERVGRAHELDAICRNAALRAAGHHLPNGALLFVNMSPQSLDHGRLDPLELVRAVRSAGLEPERVVIEITERSITRVDAIVDAAHELQKHGFRLALDDTGAGNSGLEVMTRLTLQFVKIDRDVIVKALNERNARGVLAGIIAIAEATGAYVIAEGIENTELLDFVCHIGDNVASGHGIRGVQGYLLRRPSPTFPSATESNDMRALLREFATNGASRSDGLATAS